ncbi:lectin [Pelomonas sp. CA6]|uniref:lectin n=1 Tax=Pelomonas sp. CA6 TaxID=2907999 RepID=UPI001F4BD8BE|nr:lectin [Pelomonas sp. CA6]MCH7343230.1 lectin [Pelomonas sp. CA6]
MPVLSRPLATLVAVALVLPPLAARADEQTVELRSRGEYQSYPLPEGTTEVDLDEQLSGACRFNRTWGYDLSNKELWVNGGCAARFRITTEATREDKSSNVGLAIAAAAAIAGIAILASKHKDDDRPDGGNPGSGWGSQIRGMGDMCLDIEGSARPGNGLIVFNCHGGTNQRFEWTRRGELRVAGLCLDVANGDDRDGARVIAWNCNGQSNQRWRAYGGQIRSEATGKCLDLKEGQSRPKQPVIMWRCNGGQNQRWSW